MTLPPLPEEFELNWFSKRNAFDIAVKDFIEDGGGGGGASDLADLDDVDITGATNGQALVYNGTNWVPGSALHPAANLADVASAAAARANLGALPIMPAANVGADYSIPYASAAALGARPTLPAGAVLRIWGGTTADADPTWMIDGDYRDIPVVG